MKEQCEKISIGNGFFQQAESQVVDFLGMHGFREAAEILFQKKSDFRFIEFCGRSRVLAIFGMGDIQFIHTPIDIPVKMADFCQIVVFTGDPKNRHYFGI